MFVIRSWQWNLTHKRPRGLVGDDHPWKAECIIRFIASFHPSLPGALQDSLINHLVRMDKDPEGSKALRSASRTSKIERPTDEDLKSLDYVKDLVKVIQ